MTPVATAEEIVVDADELAAKRRTEEEQLPLFEGFRVKLLDLTFGGGVPLPLSNEQHRAIKERLKLDSRITVTVRIGPHEFDLDGYVQAKGFKHRTIDSSRVMVETVRVELDSVAGPQNLD